MRFSPILVLINICEFLFMRFMIRGHKKSNGLAESMQLTFQICMLYMGTSVVCSMESSVVCVWFVWLICYVHSSVGYRTTHREYHYNVSAASVVL